MKRSGPSLGKKMVPLESCMGCRGTGIIRGVFHEMACVSCDGVGFVYAGSGNCVAPRDAVMQLRLRLNQARRQVRQLQDQLNQHGKASEFKAGRGPGGSIYRGD